MFQMKGVTSHHHFQVTVTHISILTIQNWLVLYTYVEFLSKLTSRNQTLDFII